MLTLTHVLIAIAVVVGWALFVLISPVGRCRRCDGKRVVRTAFAGRVKVCPRCRGSRRQRRLGARLVHELASPAREHLQRQIRARHHPED